MQQLQLSVVLPVYNAATFLPACLASLQAQDHPSFEVICVDDGSTDGSKRIIEDFARRDPRILLRTQDRRYAGEARNAGLREARGEFVLFLDADDFFDERLCSSVLAACERDRADICLFDHQFFHTHLRRVSRRPWTLRRDLLPKGVFSPLDVPDSLFQVATCAPWNRCFRLEFVRRTQLEFRPSIRANDIFFVQNTLARAQRITVVPEILLSYRLGSPGSLQARTDETPFLPFDELVLTRRALAQLPDWPALRKGFARHAFENCLHYLNSLQSAEAYRSVYDRLKAHYLAELQISPDDLEPYGVHRYSALTSSAWAESLLSQLSALRRERLEFGAVSWISSAIPSMDIPPEAIEQNVATSSNPTELQKWRPQISVVLPIFNAEKFLDRCLRSILNGRSIDVEVLCVDDGSTDGSLAILQRFANEDRRVRVLAGAHRGQGHARNMALNQACGEYVAFVDADDWLEEGALEIAHGEISRRALDMLCFESLRHDEVNGKVEPNVYTEHHRVLPPGFDASCFQWTDLRDHADCLWRLPVVPWGTLFRRAMLEEHQIRFPEIVMFEDNPFFWRALLRAERIGTLPRRLYHHRVHPRSAMGRMAEHLEAIPRMHRAFLVELLTEGREPEILGSFVHAVYDAWLWRLLSLPLHGRAKLFSHLHEAIGAFPTQLEGVWKPLRERLVDFASVVRRYPSLAVMRRRHDRRLPLERYFRTSETERRETALIRTILGESA